MVRYNNVAGNEARRHHDNQEKEQKHHVLGVESSWTTRDDMSRARPPMLLAWHMYAPVSAKLMEWILSPLYEPIDSILSPAFDRKGSSFFSHST